MSIVKPIQMQDKHPFMQAEDKGIVILALQGFNFHTANSFLQR
jgi:hypothetical protein